MIERIHERQHGGQMQPEPTHWLIPTSGALRIAAGVLDLAITCVGIVMVFNKEEGAAFLSYGSILTALMGFPALIVLTRALSRFEHGSAMRALAAGGSCFLISLGLNALLLSPALEPLAETPMMKVLSASFLSGVALWVIWLVWSARQRNILRSALPWFGIATNIFSIVYTTLRMFEQLSTISDTVRGLLILFLLILYVLGTGVGFIWDSWLGLFLIRGKITASDITPIEAIA